MNNQLIQKVITANNGDCPDITFSNPLLDRNVASALSKSFIEMLTTSRQSPSVNSNMRHTILNNVRKICKGEPENHIKIEEIASVLSQCYIDNIKENAEAEESIEKQLDDFLVRRMNELNYTSKYASNHNPEIIQALLNLEPSNIDALSNDILNWSIDNKNLNILNNLWTSEMANEDIYDDLSIKIKSEIEKHMLRVTHLLLTDRDSDIEMLFTHDDMLQQIITKCGVSRICFQICSGILNYLLISTNYDPRLQMFVPVFVTKVKQCCTKESFSVLYPTHLSHIALLLDFDVNILSGNARTKYVDMVVRYFHEFHGKSEYELVMLLSHFPQWFEIYFASKDITQN